MTDIKLQQLHLENFKAHKNLTIDFLGRNTSIYGDNATGKTTIYDALTWLLFGKDSMGNGEKNVEVKPLGPDGEIIDHDAITLVSALLEVDGMQVSLRREYRESWTTKRGSSEAVYSGNVSSYFVDGVPKKLNDYKAKVQEIVDEDVFRMLTSVSQFAAGIKWQDRRAVLFDICGGMDDSVVLSSDPKFLPLIQGMENRSVDDYKQMLLSQRKQFTGVRNDTPTRISECEKTVAEIEGIDFPSVSAEIQAEEAERQFLAGQIISLDHDTAKESKRQELSAAQISLRELESQNYMFRSRQPSAAAEIAEAESEWNRYNRLCLDQEQQAEYMQTVTIPAIERKIQKFRDEWVEESSKIYAGSDTCPTCGQKLPKEKIQLASASFEKTKEQKLQMIQDMAGIATDEKNKKLSDIATMKAEAKEYADKAAECMQKANELKKGEKPVQDMEGYAAKKAEITADINRLNKELAALTFDSQGEKSRLTAQLNQKDAHIRELNSTLAKKSLLERSQSRIAELQEDARNAAAALEAIENMLYLIDEYSRYKAKFVEDNVNSHFRLAKFRLSREQANGGVEDRCDVMYNGVPYIGLNNGMKINIGVDIINTLSKHYGVHVPLFVDNAEAVTHIENCDSQLIRLVVSEEDKELRVSYEA